MDKKRIIIVFLLVVIVSIFSKLLVIGNYNKPEVKQIEQPKLTDISLTGVCSNCIIQDESYISSVLNINPNTLESYYVLTSENFEDSKMVIILKPLNNKKSEVKENMEVFFTELYNWISKYSKEIANNISNRIEDEKNGYLIYIATPNNNEEIYLKIQEQLIKI